MGGYDLPETVSVGGRELPVRSDFRAILDVLAVMADAEIDDTERADVALRVFYPDAEEIDPADVEEAVSRLMWFVSGGEERRPSARPKPRVMDWEQDFPLIIAPVNRVLGFEARAVPYDYEANEGGLHWWTFLGAYYEIGDCTFAQVVDIRRKRMKGKKLDKADDQFYRDNRDIIDLRRRETTAEAQLLSEWTGKGA